MPQRPPLFAKTGGAIRTAELPGCTQGWLLDGQVRQLSERTIDSRRRLLDKLNWFLTTRELTDCGRNELRAFLAYVATGHDDSEGRWGNPRERRPVRPATTLTYYNILRSFFAFLLLEGALEASPMAGLRPPLARGDQVQPYAPQQLEALLKAACRSPFARRDEALLLFLLDTGARASEVCQIRLQEVDFQNRRVTVLGKGNKRRALPFGRVCGKALWQYLREQPREPDAPLFISDRGIRAGEAFTRSGIRDVVDRLGRAAGLAGCRCTTHRFRHTMAIEFLRAGGNVFTLKELLGHTTLTMVNRYVALAQADIEGQHRQFSPADRLRRR
jgi:site-specific recombinase XerD